MYLNWVVQAPRKVGLILVALHGFIKKTRATPADNFSAGAQKPEELEQ
jgi:hypothetical protein